MASTCVRVMVKTAVETTCSFGERVWEKEIPNKVVRGK
jgi:hypothetical protein